MKANELRIGNYISRLDLVDIHKKRIEQILELGKKATTTGSLKVISNYEDLIPIPLTEEWLIKFGFIKDGKEFNKWCGDYEYSFSFEYGFVFGQLVDYSHEIKIKHVHQLQNLYFALTGEELTIKEDETKK